jgi:hypothetical protein
MLQDNNAKIDVKALYLFSVCLKFTQKEEEPPKVFPLFFSALQYEILLESFDKVQTVYCMHNSV